MDKLTAIKIKYDDGTYSDEIPISALAENIEWDSSYSLVDILGEVAYDTKGSIQDQISQLFNEKISVTELNNYIAAQLNTDITDWLNENVNPVGSAVIVDSSLTISGAAADAKTVGINVNNLNNAILSSHYKNIDFELTIGAGVNPSTGGNYNNLSRYSRISLIPLENQRIIVFNILDDTYEFTAWTYSSKSASSGVRSLTNLTYTNNWIFIPPYNESDNSLYFRVGIQRKDHNAMSSGSSEDTDESKLKKNIKILYIPQYDEKAYSMALNMQLMKNGGSFHPILRQGSGTFTNGYLEYSYSKFRCTTYIDSLIQLEKGDIIDLNDLSAHINLVEQNSTNEIKLKEQYQVSGVPFKIFKTGLYFLNVSNIDESTELSISTAMQKITIYHDKNKNDINNLPKNPYKQIATILNNNTYTWSPRIKDILSTCDLHAVKALYFTRAKNAGYDHIAISNYHSSSPAVPIVEILPELEGYDATRDSVPENWLESPNAEHVYFSDATDWVGQDAGSHLHLCSVGSYLTSGADNTGVGEGGFNGTVKQFAVQAERLLKYPNGGGITINHPKWSGIDANGIINLLTLNNVFGMEIYNANSQHVNGKGYSLDIWDEVLSKGCQIFGTAVPDHETEGSYWNDHLPLGFIHLLCVSKDEQEIMLAYRNGRFYTTIDNDSLLLRYFGINNDGLVTFIASQSGTIKFITAQRNLVVENSTTATFQTRDNDIYIRAEIQTNNNRLFTNAILL